MLVSVANPCPTPHGFVLKSYLSFVHESRSLCIVPSQEVLFYFLEPLLSGVSPRSLSRFLFSLLWKRHITVLIVQLAKWPHLDARKAGNRSDFSGWDTTFWRLLYTVKGKCLFLLHPMFQKTTLFQPVIPLRTFVLAFPSGVGVVQMSMRPVSSFL